MEKLITRNNIERNPTGAKKMNVGYSSKSLVNKLGIKKDFKAIIINPPENYKHTLGELPDNVIILNSLQSSVDFIHFFTISKKELIQEFPKLKEALDYNGMLWISWPKGSSKMETDLKESIVRKIGLYNGLVDIKVCAVDKNWSGIKFVYRVKDRK